MSKRRRASWIPAIILLAIVVGGTTVFTSALERNRARWAFGVRGGDPLADSWVGRLTTATGRPRAVLFDIELAESRSRHASRVGRGYPHGGIDGIMRTCDERGTVREYTVDGEPKDRDAARFTVHAKPVEQPPSDGLTFSWIQGRWDQGDALVLTPSFFWRRGTGAISGPDYPDTQRDPELPMRRGGESEFRALCDAIRGGAR